jgi:hypothetical protein
VHLLVTRLYVTIRTDRRDKHAAVGEERRRGTRRALAFVYGSVALWMLLGTLALTFFVAYVVKAFLGIDVLASYHPMRMLLVALRLCGG